MLTKKSTRPTLLGKSRARSEIKRLDSASSSAAASSASSSMPGNLLSAIASNGYCGPATVEDVNTRERLVLVRWVQAGKTDVIWARLALATTKPLQRGDVALIVSQDLKEAYVIGLLSAPLVEAQPKSLSPELESHARVKVTRVAGKEVVQIHSAQKELVVEYHPESGKTVINVEQGDLEFVTQKGSIAFNAAQKISLVAPRLETHAETVVAKAKNVYETVEELSQLQAGRTRTLVKGTCLLKARDAFLKAEADFKIDGTQIHLG